MSQAYDVWEELSKLRSRCENLPKLDREIGAFMKDLDTWKRQLMDLARTPEVRQNVYDRLRIVQNAANSFEEWVDPERPRDGFYANERDKIGLALQRSFDDIEEVVSLVAPRGTLDLRTRSGVSLTVPIPPDERPGESRSA
ncbi:hypothetical protein AB0M50_09210 [Nonomuraea fuscirosea]|jgi:hypothetical protein|uniref:hypothetical protein n=1 Tax=Nonomuraea fuscirosea TaxID=1291556 RepID=UPI002DD7C665|nr:hypothetical protein [Nonomuraea fuscirosea]WSA51652.1 hypothetical protein OIE67_47715 [Nonomuraea fuscirosea]